MNAKHVNAKLFGAIKRAGLNQTIVAKKSGVQRQYISLHINGHWILTDAEKQSIADVLGKPVSELFNKVEGI